MWRNFFLRGTVVVLLTAAAPAGAQSAVFQSGPDRVTLLELFTSEGCSSCPPAEEWMSRLRSSKDLWKKVVPVVFHVDYWNHLGWKDALSSQAFSNLQRAYARRWGSSSVYTPMFVRNGQEFREWFTHEDVPRTWRKKTGRLTAEALPDGQWKVTYEPLPSMGAPVEYQAYAAILGFGIRSHVTAGENNGLDLTHDFVVLGSRKDRLYVQQDKLVAVMTLPKPESATAQKLALAVWVTGTKEQVLQATGGYLPEEKLNG